MFNTPRSRKFVQKLSDKIVYKLFEKPIDQLLQKPVETLSKKSVETLSQRPKDSKRFMHLKVRDWDFDGVLSTMFGKKKALRLLHSRAQVTNKHGGEKK